MATDETKTKILEAAGPIFAAKGFRDATVREICDAAGVGLASVNYHFGDKQQLYVRVVEHAWQYLKANWPERPSDVPAMPADQRLAAWVRRLTQILFSETRASWQDRIFTREFLDPTPACEEFLRTRASEDLGPLMEIVTSVMGDETPKLERWRVVFNILGQILFYDTYGRFVEVLLGEEADGADFSKEAIATQVTLFSAGALGLAPTMKRSGSDCQ